MEDWLATYLNFDHAVKMSPLELLSRISEGFSVSSSDLDHLINANPKEGQHLDYKSGLLTDESGGSIKIRRHVSGMSNAAGGILLIGVKDDGTIDGITLKGGRGPKGWAENCLAPLVALFTTPPQLREVQHGTHTVLVIAIHRNGRLIPCIELGKIKYHLRLGDQTLEAPEFHVADLLLGRRELPVIEIRVGKGTLRDSQGGGFDFLMELDLVNEGAIWVEEVKVGLIGLHLYNEQQTKEKLPNSMRANLEVEMPAQTWAYSSLIGMKSYSDICGKIAPLDSQLSIKLGPLKIDVHTLSRNKILYLKAAIFCIPRNGTIQWYQLKCAIGNTQYSGRIVSPIQLIVVSGSLIDIAWHPLDPPAKGLNLMEHHDWEEMLKKQRVTTE